MQVKRRGAGLVPESTAIFGLQTTRPGTRCEGSISGDVCLVCSGPPQSTSFPTWPTPVPKKLPQRNRSVYFPSKVILAFCRLRER